MLYVAALTLLLTACSSDGDSYSAPSLCEVTAANQCMEQCQRLHDSGMTSRSGFGSGGSVGTGVATQRHARCDKRDNPALRRSCQASAHYCRNRLPGLTCGANRSRCMDSCGG